MSSPKRRRNGTGLKPRRNKSELPAPTLLQERDQSKRELRVSYSTMRRMELRGLLRVVKFPGGAKIYHFVEDIKKLVESAVQP
jgi:hypothetical protein